MTFDSESVDLSISELAELLHTSKSALRYYEKEGLIKPQRAESSGYRRYTFQSLIELSDVMLYRGLGIPVKDVRMLLDTPIERTNDKLDEAEDDLLVQMHHISDALERIASRRRRIRLYQATRAAGDHLVAQPVIERLYRFELNKPESMGSYLNNPESVRYGAFFPHADDASSYLDGAVTPGVAGKLEVLWSRPKEPGRWLECLMRTEYSHTGENDLSSHVALLERQGYRAGGVVAEYLTFDYDSQLGRRMDYYRTWIEALQDKSQDDGGSQ